MENSDNIKVISKEGTEFVITKKSADLSVLLKNAREEMGSDDSIPLVEVDTKSLEKIIQYLNKWNGEQPSEIEKPLKSSILKEVTDEWSAEFIDNLDLEELTNITVSANYMEITPLLDLACAKLASMCKDKSEDEIFKSFGIVDTFSEEERQKLKEENKWIEENLN
jgi:S-phase kinase-associated protein 1